jgi:AraC-like DNA-binding protein
MLLLLSRSNQNAMKIPASVSSNTLVLRKPSYYGHTLTSVGHPAPGRTLHHSFIASSPSSCNAQHENHQEVIISICQDFILSMESQWSGLLLQANEYGPVLHQFVSELKKLITTKPETAHLFPGVKHLKHGSQDHHFLKSVQGILEQNLDETDFGLDQFADALCVSKSRLYRKLIELTGSRPNELIRHYRLLRARTMLKDEAGSIKEIAYGCGFSNLSYFAKCFREHFGVLPSEVHKLS